MVSMLAFYSDDLSSNPAEANCFSVLLMFGKNKNKQTGTGVGPFKKEREKDGRR